MDAINVDIKDKDKDKQSTPTSTKGFTVPILNLPGGGQGLQRRGTATPSSARRFIQLETLHESDYLDDPHNQGHF